MNDGVNDKVNDRFADIFAEKFADMLSDRETDIIVKFARPEDKIVRVTEKVTEKVTERVAEKEKEVIELLQEYPSYTTSQMAQKLSVTRKTVAQYIKSLKSKDIIEHVGSDRKGYWRIN